jgi:hypothetical protein
MIISRLRIPAAIAVLSLAAVTSAATAASAAPAAPATGSHASSQAAAKPDGHIKAPVTGKFKNAAGTGTFTGKFSPKRFKVVNGQLKATGVLTGKLVNAKGKDLGTVRRTITETVETNASKDVAGCNVLNLVLGPLHLNLLGLVVNLNTVHLNITAVPGVGNLLGNLLCAIASLLNGGGPLSQISALLNQVLSLI